MGYLVKNLVSVTNRGGSRGWAAFRAQLAQRHDTMNHRMLVPRVGLSAARLPRHNCSASSIARTRCSHTSCHCPRLRRKKTRVTRTNRTRCVTRVPAPHVGLGASFLVALSSESAHLCIASRTKRGQSLASGRASFVGFHATPTIMLAPGHAREDTVSLDVTYTNGVCLARVSAGKGCGLLLATAARCAASQTMEETPGTSTSDGEVIQLVRLHCSAS